MRTTTRWGRLSSVQLPRQRRPAPAPAQMAHTIQLGTHTLRAGNPTLAYTLHRPPASTSAPRRAALIAHPYGRLGGSKQDHVVQALAEFLADEGFLVVRFDARGAGESTGSTSWTCVPLALSCWTSLRRRTLTLTSIPSQRRSRSGRLSRARRRPRPPAPLPSSRRALFQPITARQHTIVDAIRPAPVRLLVRLARRLVLSAARRTTLSPLGRPAHVLPPRQLPALGPLGAHRPPHRRAHRRTALARRARRGARVCGAWDRGRLLGRRGAAALGGRARGRGGGKGRSVAGGRGRGGGSLLARQGEEERDARGGARVGQGGLRGGAAAGMTWPRSQYTSQRAEVHEARARLLATRTRADALALAGSSSSSPTRASTSHPRATRQSVHSPAPATLHAAAAPPRPARRLPANHSPHQLPPPACRPNGPSRSSS